MGDSGGCGARIGGGCAARIGGGCGARISGREIFGGLLVNTTGADPRPKVIWLPVTSLGYQSLIYDRTVPEVAHSKIV